MGIGERSPTSSKKSTMAFLVIDQWNVLGTNTRAKSAPFLCPVIVCSRMSLVLPPKQPTVMGRFGFPFAFAASRVLLTNSPFSAKVSAHDSPLEPATTTIINQLYSSSNSVISCGSKHTAMYASLDQVREMLFLGRPINLLLFSLKEECHGRGVDPRRV